MANSANDRKACGTSKKHTHNINKDVRIIQYIGILNHALGVLTGGLVRTDGGRIFGDIRLLQDKGVCSRRFEKFSLRDAGTRQELRFLHRYHPFDDHGDRHVTFLPKKIEIGFHPIIRGLSASTHWICYASLFGTRRGKYQPFRANSKINYKVGNWH